MLHKISLDQWKMAQTLEDLEQFDPKELDEMLGEMLSRNGYTVPPTSSETSTSPKTQEKTMQEKAST